MKTSHMPFLVMIVLALVLGAAAQGKLKPWTEWSLKDVEKIMNDSPWGRTQTETDTSQMMFKPGMGGSNQAASVNFRIRLLSAKPIRQALARQVELSKSKYTEEQLNQARQFIDKKYDDSIVVAVSFDGDNRLTGPVIQTFFGAQTSSLTNNTFLEFKGKRLFLKEYQPPSQDGLGAKFIFARTVDDKPFVDAKSGEVRFYAEFPKLGGSTETLALNMRFKIAEWMYEGVIEF
jgi:hypothetical protein